MKNANRYTPLSRLLEFCLDEYPVKLHLETSVGRLSVNVIVY